MEATPVSTQALPAGTRIEEFVIERVLGSGGFGITYLARDVRLDRQVVIKENLPAQFCFRDTHSLTVAPRHSHGDDVDNFRWSLENFSKEAAMLASLDHPGIVKVLRSFEALGTAYFVMPFVEGLALDQLAKNRQGKPFSEDELRGLLERVLSALGYLHDRGIYHRDIKPGNLLITNEGIPTLIDFGSARQRLSERSMTVVESAGYTPFEQLQSRGNVGPWSDLYALGATMVKIMTGEAPPKTNDRSFGDPWQPLADRAELEGKFSKDFLSGIDRSLKLPVTERWQDAGAWLKALSSIATVKIQPSVAEGEKQPPDAVEIPGRTAHWLLWIIAACIVMALFGMANNFSNKDSKLSAVAVAGESAAQREREKTEVTIAHAQEAERTARAEQEKQARAKAKEEAAIAQAKEDKQRAARAEHEMQALAAQAKANEEEATVIKATKDQPFVNSLGMKFVPVSITGDPSAGQQVLFSIWETRVQDFAEFVNNSRNYRYESGTTPSIWDGKEWKQLEGASWKIPGFTQTQTDPVTCVSHDDAVAFCEWLTQQERSIHKIQAHAMYRLPTDHEWSCAVGIGNREDAAAPPESKDGKMVDVFPWGTQWPPPKDAGNYATSLKVDRYQRTSPAGTFSANGSGIHDLGGNVWEWCEDAYKSSSPRRVLRGASWLVNGRGGLSSSFRSTGSPEYRGSSIGFRCVFVVERAGDVDQWDIYVNKRFGFQFSHPTSMKSESAPTNGAGMNFFDGKFSVTAEAHFLVDKSFDEWWDETIKELGKAVTYKVKKTGWCTISGIKSDGTEFYFMRHVKGTNWAQFSATYPHSMNGQYDPVVERMAKEFVPFLPGNYDRAPPQPSE